MTTQKALWSILWNKCPIYFKRNLAICSAGFVFNGGWRKNLERERFDLGSTKLEVSGSRVHPRCHTRKRRVSLNLITKCEPVYVGPMLTLTAPARSDMRFVMSCVTGNVIRSLGALQISHVHMLKSICGRFLYRRSFPPPHTHTPLTYFLEC